MLLRPLYSLSALIHLFIDVLNILRESVNGLLFGVADSFITHLKKGALQHWRWCTVLNQGGTTSAIEQDVGFGLFDVCALGSSHDSGNGLSSLGGCYSFHVLVIAIITALHLRSRYIHWYEIHDFDLLWWIHQALMFSIHTFRSNNALVNNTFNFMGALLVPFYWDTIVLFLVATECVLRRWNTHFSDFELQVVWSTMDDYLFGGLSHQLITHLNTFTLLFDLIIRNGQVSPRLLWLVHTRYFQILVTFSFEEFQFDAILIFFAVICDFYKTVLGSFGDAHLDWSIGWLGGHWYLAALGRRTGHSVLSADDSCNWQIECVP